MKCLIWNFKWRNKQLHNNELIYIEFELQSNYPKFFEFFNCYEIIFVFNGNGKKLWIYLHRITIRFVAFLLDRSRYPNNNTSLRRMEKSAILNCIWNFSIHMGNRPFFWKNVIVENLVFTGLVVHPFFSWKHLGLIWLFRYSSFFTKMMPSQMNDFMHHGFKRMLAHDFFSG